MLYKCARRGIYLSWTKYSLDDLKSTAKVPRSDGPPQKKSRKTSAKESCSGSGWPATTRINGHTLCLRTLGGMSKDLCPEIIQLQFDVCRPLDFLPRTCSDYQYLGAGLVSHAYGYLITYTIPDVAMRHAGRNAPWPDSSAARLPGRARSGHRCLLHLSL